MTIEQIACRFYAPEEGTATHRQTMDTDTTISMEQTATESSSTVLDQYTLWLTNRGMLCLLVQTVVLPSLQTFCIDSYGYLKLDDFHVTNKHAYMSFSQCSPCWELMLRVARRILAISWLESRACDCNDSSTDLSTYDTLPVKPLLRLQAEAAQPLVAYWTQHLMACPFGVTASAVLNVILSCPISTNGQRMTGRQVANISCIKLW